MGKFMSEGDDSLNIQIVGLAAAVLPVLAPAGERGLYFYTRTGRDPADLLCAVPGVIERLDPNLPVEELKGMPRQGGGRTSSSTG